MLTTHIESNKKFGHGFQARMIIDGYESVIDDPVIDSLAEIVSAVGAAVDTINEQTGRNYQLHEVLRLDHDAIEENKHSDFTTALVAKDIATGEGRIICKQEESDIKTQIIDGEEQEMISLRGILLIGYNVWKGPDGNPKKGYNIMQTYCRYLAVHGYGAGATAIFNELDALTKNDAINWIKQTFDTFVGDQMELFNQVASIINAES